MNTLIQNHFAALQKQFPEMAKGLGGHNRLVKAAKELAAKEANTK